MSSVARSFLEANHRLSRLQTQLARRLVGRRDGNTEWLRTGLPSLLVPGQRVLDVGGGKNPAIPMARKAELGLHVTGLDISADELRQAPAGAYDAVIVQDICTAVLEPKYDLIVSTAVLEHVHDLAAAFGALRRGLAPGGRTAHFIPCGRSVFARLNRAVGNDVAKRALSAFFPKAGANQGFVAYYDRCWPSALRRLAAEEGLEVTQLETYFQSGYFSFFAPLHTIEVGWQVMKMHVPNNEDLCESFVIVASAPAR